MCILNGRNICTLHASLDGLLKEQARQQAFQAAETVVEHTSPAVTANLLRVRPEVILWRENFEHALAKIEELVKALPEIENEIYPL